MEIYISRERERTSPNSSHLWTDSVLSTSSTIFRCSKKKRHPSISGLPRLGNDVSALGSGQCSMPQDEAFVGRWVEEQELTGPYSSLYSSRLYPERRVTSDTVHAQIVRFVVDIWVIYVLILGGCPMFHFTGSSEYQRVKDLVHQLISPMKEFWKKNKHHIQCLNHKKKWNAKTTHIMIIQWVLPKHWFIVDHEA